MKKVILNPAVLVLAMLAAFVFVAHQLEAQTPTTTPPGVIVVSGASGGGVAYAPLGVNANGVVVSPSYFSWASNAVPTTNAVTINWYGTNIWNGTPSTFVQAPYVGTAVTLTSGGVFLKFGSDIAHLFDGNPAQFVWNGNASGYGGSWSAQSSDTTKTYAYKGTVAGYQYGLDTNQFVIAASGWTNTNAFNCIARVSMSSATYTYSDGFRAIETGSSVTTTVPTAFELHPGWSISAASGLSGKAVAQ